MRQNTPLIPKSGNAKMHPDHKNARPGGPLMPTLSASAKASNRNPITPRVAGSTATGTTTPVSRRAARLTDDNGSDRSQQWEQDPKGHQSMPVALLNHNITPRSGSRKSRVDSTNTTPLGTPNGTPAPPSSIEPYRVQDTPSHETGLGAEKRPSVSFGTTTTSSYPRSPTLSETSKFFFASDAKSAQTPRPPLPNKSSSASSTFLYANGAAIPRPQSSYTPATSSIIAEERAQPKFFHANGTPDLQASPNLPLPARPSSSLSSTSRIISPRVPGTGTFSPPQRPSSPTKPVQLATIINSRGPPPPISPTLPRPPSVSHSRSTSITSPDVNDSLPKRTSSGSHFENMVSSTQLNIITNTPSVTSPEGELVESEQRADELPSGLQSPIKAGHSLERMNELAANARRERKVLDLEITNSSLAAINRTLERQMRKQTAELRRYRRLSRSGRLSIASTATRITSAGSLSMDESAVGKQLSDMSEEESAEESEDDLSEDSIDDGSLSPAAIIESDLRHRQKDEQRLQLDLSKHQQLLVDSQKMNQSLKRCLGWTEEMISDGKKQLAYTVRVSDVELGGRVLAPDELNLSDELNASDEIHVPDELDAPGDEELDEAEAQLLEEDRLAVERITAWSGQGRDDRDSGIEVEGTT